MNARRMIAGALAAAVLGAAPIAGAAVSEERPDATIELTGTSFAIGIGWDSASGTLVYQGREIPVSVHGISLARIGASNYHAVGNVYNLHDISDFAGTFGVVSMGGGILQGGSAMAMKNENGVVIKMTTASGGLEVDFGVKGLAMSLQ